MTQKKTSIAVAVSMLLAVSGAHASVVTLKALKRDFASNGPRHTIARYFSDCNEGSGYRLIESGNPAAVRLAVELLRFSDACVSKSLQSSLGRAMAIAPEVVLLYVNSSDFLKASDICVPFISEDESASQTAEILRGQKQSLMRVHSAWLAKQKAACLDVVAGFAAR